MAFPEVTTLLEDFEGTGWLSNWTAFFGSGITNDFNETMATGQGASDNSDASYKNNATYGPSGHFYAEEEVNTSGAWQAIHFVTTPGSGTTDGYAIYVSYTGTTRIRCYRIDNDSLTQLGSQVSYTPADGNLVGLERDSGNGNLEAWSNTGSGWTDLGGNWNDTTYNSGTSWRVGLECSYNFDSTGHGWRNLWGGTSTTSSGGLVGPLIRGGRLCHGALLRGGVLVP